MKIFKFWGSSDDLFYCAIFNDKLKEFKTIAELSKPDKPMSYYIERDDNPDEAVVITAIYTNASCWSIGLSLYDESYPIDTHDWIFDFDLSFYENELTVMCPDNYVLVHKDKDIN